MSRGARIVLLSVALAAALATLAGTRDDRRAASAAVPQNPTPLPPEPVPVPPPSGPCADPLQRCPDLVVQPPSDLVLRRSRSGRLRLGSRNILVNRGAGPLYLIGERLRSRRMSVLQRIYTVSGTHHDHPLADARFDFWFIPGQGRYWKLRDGLRFELWTADEPVERRVEVGIKTRFCMRDLREVRGLPGPRHRNFPACSQAGGAQSVRMGISVGWAESYPAFYHEQYVDVTGLRGCYTLRHIADPRQRVYESDESNNSSRVKVRLTRRGARAGRC